MTIRNTLTAAVAATAIAFAGVTPAAAAPDNNDLLKLIIGLGVVGLLAGAANHSPAQPSQLYVTPRPYPQPQPYPLPQYHPLPQPYPKPQPHPVALPTNCAIKFQTRNGWERGYTTQCLASYGYNRALPANCMREIRTTYGWNRIYGDYCLRQAGF